MLVGTLASLVLVGLTILVHFEYLRFAPRVAERVTPRPRLRVVVMLLGAFAAHTAEVYIYACAYMLLDVLDPASGFGGIFEGTFEDYLYFSAITYTSLGYGDILPEGAFRLLSGTEALNGLVMIAWTASATYLMMERYWRRD